MDLFLDTKPDFSEKNIKKSQVPKMILKVVDELLLMSYELFKFFKIFGERKYPLQMGKILLYSS